MVYIHVNLNNVDGYRSYYAAYCIRGGSYCCVLVLYHLCLCVLQNMALHIVRSLGQAFDVCHRLNPRPKKTKKEEGEEGKKVEGENEEVVTEGKGDQDSSELVSGVKDISLSEGGEKQREPTQQNDLIGLDFDPFSFNFEAPAGSGTLPNGAPQAGFNTSFTGSEGGVPPTTFPPLMVGNNPSGFPELPLGDSAAQKQLQLTGRPRPRPANPNQPVS